VAVYGRLDVYWPNGPIENFALEKPEIAIGRLPGNDIVLDTTTLSRYHVKISHSGDQVRITDLESINGTYIDGVRLAANQTYLLKGGEEIQIGDIRMIFQPVIVIANDPTTISRNPPESPKQTGDNPTEPTAPLIEPLGFITVLADATITVTPGAHNQTHTDIQNISDKTERYTIRVDGAPAGWARLERMEFELEPGDRTPIAISFKPTRRSDSRPGDYSLTVHVAEKDNPAHEIVEPLLLKVRDFGGFGIALASSHARPDGTFDAYVHNQGNTPLSLTFIGADPANAFTFDIQPAAVTLAPGERQTIRGHLHLKRAAWTGAARDQRFDFIARSNNAAGFQAPVSGKYTVRGLLPLWIASMIIPLLVGIGLIVVALGGVFVVLPALQPTATNTATATATSTQTFTPTATNTSTATDTATFTETMTATATLTDTPTDTPTDTLTASPTASLTASMTDTATYTATASLTNTPLPTNPPPATNTAVVANSSGKPNGASVSNSPTTTATTEVPTVTITPSPSETPTATKKPLNPVAPVIQNTTH
jgi:pSer/pThr/pTyr-binding forkhead associated (FHA) protein